MKRRLSDFVELIPGVNTTRIDRDHGDKEIFYYDSSSFEADLSYDNGLSEEFKNISNKNIPEKMQDKIVEEGDVVISSSLMLATIVGKANGGKILSLNYIKVKFKGSRLDKRYFIYLFNENKDVKRVKLIGAQGSAIQRMNTRIITDIEIPIVTIKTQKQIGDAYSKSLKLQSKLEMKKRLLKEFTITVLEKRLEEKDETIVQR